MTDEIEWGEWQVELRPAPYSGDFMQRRINGVWETRFPKPKVENVYGYYGQYGGQYSIKLTLIDGVMQPTATVEPL